MMKYFSSSHKSFCDVIMTFYRRQNFSVDRLIDSKIVCCLSKKLDKTGPVFDPPPETGVFATFGKSQNSGPEFCHLATKV